MPVPKDAVKNRQKTTMPIIQRSSFFMVNLSLYFDVV